MTTSVAVCPHCKHDNSHGHCEHWICSKDEDILKVLVATYVSKDYDPQKLEAHRGKYYREYIKWAMETNGGWFTRTKEGEIMKRRLQRAIVAMTTVYGVK
jgi:hypothetical protein